MYPFRSPSINVIEYTSKNIYKKLKNIPEKICDKINYCHQINWAAGMRCEFQLYYFLIVINNKFKSYCK